MKYLISSILREKNRLKTILITLLTSAYCFGQSPMEEFGSKACKCIDIINIKTDEVLVTFNEPCISLLLEENKEVLLEEYKITSISKPEFVTGFNDAQHINAILFSELILNCDKYYKQFKKVSPLEIPLPEANTYGDGEIDSLTKYINLNISLYKNYYSRAVAYAKREMYKKAILDLDKVIELKPNEPYTYLIKAYIYQKTNNFEQAFLEYKNSYDRSGDNELLILMSFAKRRATEKQH